MHEEAKAFVREVLSRTGPRIAVIEVGSRDINGNVRDLLGEATYTGIDPVAGPNVDVLSEATRYTPPALVDTVLCLEVLEHVQHWRDIVARLADYLLSGGVCIITCATHERAPHSAGDGGALSPGEWYGNIDRAELEACVCRVGMQVEWCQHDQSRGDLYLYAVKPPRTLELE